MTSNSDTQSSRVTRVLSGVLVLLALGTLVFAALTSEQQQLHRNSSGPSYSYTTVDCIVEASRVRTAPCCSVQCNDDHCNALNTSFAHYPCSEITAAAALNANNSLLSLSPPATPQNNSLSPLAPLFLNSSLHLVPLSGFCFDSPSNCPSPSADDQPTTIVSQQCNYSCNVCFVHSVSVLVPPFTVDPDGINWNRLLLSSNHSSADSANKNQSVYNDYVGARLKCYYQKGVPETLILSLEYISPVSTLLILFLTIPSIILVAYILYATYYLLSLLFNHIFSKFAHHHQQQQSYHLPVLSTSNSEHTPPPAPPLPEQQQQKHNRNGLALELSIFLILGVIIPFGVLRPIYETGVINAVARRVVFALTYTSVIIGTAPIFFKVMRIITEIVINAVLGSHHRSKPRKRGARRWVEYLFRNDATDDVIFWWVVLIVVYILVVACPVTEVVLIALAKSGGLGSVRRYLDFSVSSPHVSDTGLVVDDVVWKVVKWWKAVEIAMQFVCPVVGGVVYAVALVLVLGRRGVRGRWKAVEPIVVENR